MVESAAHSDTSPQTDPARSWRLWFGLLGGLAAWVLHLSIAYPLLYNGCAFGLSGVEAWLLVLTVVLALVALAATLVAFHTWRSGRSHASRDAAESPSSRQLLAMLGIGFSGLSTLIIVMSSIVIVGLGPCR